MKKIASIATATAAAILLTATVSAADVPLKRLGKTAEYNSSATVSTASLLSSRSVKNTLVVKSDEAMIIPAGKKLVLKRGCRVKGTLYIQEGGKLSVSGGTLEITGSVINDGTISVGSRASVNIKKNGELYTSANGTFKSTTKNVTVNSSATVACFGTSSISGSKASKALDPNAVSAIKTTTTDGSVTSTQKISTVAAMKMADSEYFTDEELPAGCSYVDTSLLFDNGNSLKFTFVNGQLISIGDAEMRSIMLTANIQNSTPSDYSHTLADMWLKKWKTISADQAMVKPYLTVYSYQINANTMFAALIYSSYKSQNAVFYRIDNNKVTEIGESPCGLEFEMLKNGGSYILHTTKTLTSLAGADDSGLDGKIITSVIDTYFNINTSSVKVLGEFERNSLGSVTNSWSSMKSDGTTQEITSGEYKDLQAAICEGYNQISSVDFDKNNDLMSDDYFDFSKNRSGLAKYLAEKINFISSSEIPDMNTP